jgi:hypothetical protein
MNDEVDNRFPGMDLKPGSPEYEAGVQTAHHDFR